MTSFTNHPNPINLKFFELLNEKKLLDVILVSNDGKFFHGHKLVLAAASSYFEEIFNILPEQQHPVIVLKDISYQQIQQMMHFIYCGTVHVTSQESPAFKQALEIFKIEFDQQVEASDDESSVDSQEFEYMVNVDEPDWMDVNIKDEPEEGSCVSSVKEEPENDEDSNQCSEATEKPLLVNKRDQQPSTSSVPRLLKPSSFYKSIKITTKSQTPITLNRVVPSKRIQNFMNSCPEICPFCERKCKTSKHRNEHVKYCYTNPNRIVSVCQLCKKSVCDPYYLRKHMRNVHGKGQSWGHS